MLKQIAIDIAVVLGIPAMIVGVYYTVMGPEASLLLSSESPQSMLTADGTEELGSRSQSLLAQLTGIHFDDSIFKDPAFWSLKDFSKPIATTTLGRVYPFTPSADVLKLLEKTKQTDASTEVSTTKQATTTPFKSTKKTR